MYSPKIFIYFFLNFILFLNLKHCICFAKHQNESATGIHVLPILKPPPSFLLPPHSIPLGRPSVPAPSIQYRALNLDWRLVSYLILYIFQCSRFFLKINKFLIKCLEPYSYVNT